VRFRDPGVARGLIVSGLRHALAEAGHRASSTVAGATLGAMRRKPAPRVYQMDRPSPGRAGQAARRQAPGICRDAGPARPGRASRGRAGDRPDGHPPALPLGAARAQVHENYIIAQTETGMVIVDQHAAHERLVYETLKASMAETGVAAQALLIPEIVIWARRCRAAAG
jgi:DNA mismatch repair protein MutL